MVFPIVMYGRKSWTIKEAECWRIDAFELWCWRRLLRVPWTTRRSKQSILKEVSPEIFIGRTDAEAEAPILWPPDGKSWLIGKDFDAGRDWGQEEKGTTEDELAGWHHWFNGRESEWPPGVGNGQGGLACCDSWGRKESDTTERLNWSELKIQRKKTDLIYFARNSCFFELPKVKFSGNASTANLKICYVCFLHTNHPLITEFFFFFFLSGIRWCWALLKTLIKNN